MAGLRLAEVTQGEVFHDGLPCPAAEGVPWQRGPQPGGLEAVRGLRLASESPA
ncbi:hypothetical protein [Nonomuraea harbinensis]|uniref:Uncharacterized protein n=1 Tax=Nonomuraea harbinensis TaxID=1286938 RepID=A0ABW1C3M7_9ACTN|nr:hypothetical protein [Nonomuraea harbinensis]